MNSVNKKETQYEGQAQTGSIAQEVSPETTAYNIPPVRLKSKSLYLDPYEDELETDVPGMFVMNAACVLCSIFGIFYKKLKNRRSKNECKKYNRYSQ